MKKIFLYIIILLASEQNLQAQDIDSLRNAALNQTNAPKVKASNIPGAILPKFTVLKVDSSKFNTGSIESNKNVVLMMFNPQCGHCKEETKLFIEHAEKMPETQFVLITGDQVFSYIPDFMKDVKYENTVNKSQIIIGADIDFATINLFAYEGLPQIMVYGKNKKLIDVFYKDVAINKIKSALARDKSNLTINAEPQKLEVVKDQTVKEFLNQEVSAPEPIENLKPTTIKKKKRKK